MSGSITDAEFTNALEQVLQIVHAYNHRITVVECDNEVRRTYTMESVKDVKPRLDVRGALAEYIKEIESTDSEERYMNLDWYYDFNMLLRRIEVPGVPSEKFKMTGVPAKVLTQTRSNPDELVCFGCPDFISTSKPVSMGQDDYQNFLMWQRENRD